jgi:hypothetical protein
VRAIFVNSGPENLSINWKGDAAAQKVAVIMPKEHFEELSWHGHVWLVKRADGRVVHELSLDKAAGPTQQIDVHRGTITAMEQPVPYTTPFEQASVDAVASSPPQQTPFNHQVVNGVFSDAAHEGLRAEVMRMTAHEETAAEGMDFAQTCDITAVDRATFPHIAALADNLSGEPMRKLIHQLTGAGGAAGSAAAAGYSVEATVCLFPCKGHWLCHRARDERLDGADLGLWIFLVDSDWNESHGGGFEVFGTGADGRPGQLARRIVARPVPRLLLLPAPGLLRVAASNLAPTASTSPCAASTASASSCSPPLASPCCCCCCCCC